MVEKTPKFQLVPVAQFADRPYPSWLIRDILPQAEYVTLIGEPGTAKTFLALDWAMSIARGDDWFGHKTKQGRVVYIAAEAQNGFAMRLRAYAKHHMIDLADIDMQIIHDIPKFNGNGDVKLIYEQIKLSEQMPLLIVVDTLAKVTPGTDESSSKEMGLALEQTLSLHKLTGALILLVHHCGKDATKGGRGWSGIKGNGDAEFEVTGVENPRTLKTHKQKDAARSTDINFRITPLELGEDQDGYTVTSCFVETTEVLPKSVKPPKENLGTVEEIVWKTYQRLANIEKSSLIDQVILVEQSVSQLYQPKDKRDQREMRVGRAIEGLCKRGKLQISGSFITRV